tara:strand:+ start:386 stop:685 length:300 start_codon:yes stop_codon:yes gene_type:complete
VPLVRPVIVNGEEDPVAVIPLGVEVAKYPVIVAGTPAKEGVENEIVAAVSPASALTLVVALGDIGHAWPPISCNWWDSDHTPEKVGIILPPLYAAEIDS